jgi:hypothetical protein
MYRGAIVFVVVVTLGGLPGGPAIGQPTEELEKLERALMEAQRQDNVAEMREIKMLMEKLSERETEDETASLERIEQLERELAVARRTGNSAEVEEVTRLLQRLTYQAHRDATRARQRRESIDVRFDGVSDVEVSSASCGFTFLYARGSESQLAVMEPTGVLVGSMSQSKTITIAIPVRDAVDAFRITAVAEVWRGTIGQVSLSLNGTDSWHEVGTTPERLTVSGESVDDKAVLTVKLKGLAQETSIRLSRFKLRTEVAERPVAFSVDSLPIDKFPRPELPAMRPSIERALIEWDWRMQDGIGTERQGSSYDRAVANTIARGNDLVEYLKRTESVADEMIRRWGTVAQRWRRFRSSSAVSEVEWERLWRDVHQLRRTIVLQNPLADTGPIAFVKCVPTNNSIMQQQYVGRFARPAGGVFVLEDPGQSMRCRTLTRGVLPAGAYQHLDVSYDGKQVLFAFCETARPPQESEGNPGHVFNIYQVQADGSEPVPLIDTPHDDFAPRYLPNGNIVFVSTRRGGYSRCGPDYSPCHTLALADSTGRNQRLISFHEIHEFDPAVMNDGRIIYTRWDYVDREASHYQQLWVTRPDGTNPAIYYGNNTFNPMATFESRSIPGSNRVMAIAGCHHSIAAGSVVLIDVTRGVDGLAALERLTPEVLFPETEAAIHDLDDSLDDPVPVQARRWPHHTYKSPLPLSEEVFLASYSYDALVYRETEPNPANMFGLYLVDRFGNKELLHRDLNVSSLWAMPLRARRTQSDLPKDSDPSAPTEGTFYVQNVYEADPPLPTDVKIAGLRVIQVFPRTSELETYPVIGIPAAACGRQVLGTVPVEADGSAYFKAPAGVALSFQALDKLGQSVQFMRSITYLQPGENVSCVGCHEHRTMAPPHRRLSLALKRAPSEIQPGPSGSMPFSYPRLVQPVLDRHCVRCHNEQNAEGDIVLTGTYPRSEEEGEQVPFTISYFELAPRVKYAQWASAAGDSYFRVSNSEPITQPDFFGARSTPLIAMLRAGHEGVTLNDEELERLVTWADNNVLFYGTFDPDDQARQRKGLRISGPAVD